MPTVAHTSSPVYYAHYTAPDGTLLYGTAQETMSGMLFLDEAGFTPFYASRNAVTLCGVVTLAEEQRTHDTQGQVWMQGMLTHGCTVQTA